MSLSRRLRPWTAVLIALAVSACGSTSSTGSASSGSATTAGPIAAAAGSAAGAAGSATAPSAGTPAPATPSGGQPSGVQSSAAGSAAPSSGGRAEVDAAARALLSADLRAKGVLLNGVNLPNPPMEFTDAGSSTPKGLDIDLATAIAARLGLTVKFDNVQFDQLLPGLATGRDDMVLSALSDTPERQKVATWIDYFNSGDRFFVSAANAATFHDQVSLCGQTVVVASGTSFVQDVPALSSTVCAGKAPITVLAVGISGNAGLELQLTTGRAAAAVTGAETFGYLTQTETGKWAAVGDIFAKSPYGIAVRPADTQLRDALTMALSHMVTDGSYAAILAKWAQQASAVQKVTVNLK